MEKQVCLRETSCHPRECKKASVGLVRELMKLIECVKQKPTGKINHLRHKNWDPILNPDLVVFNAVLNACVPSQQWQGVFWVFEQLRKNGIRPSGGKLWVGNGGNGFNLGSMIWCTSCSINETKWRNAKSHHLQNSRQVLLGGRKNQ